MTPQEQRPRIGATPEWYTRSGCCDGGARAQAMMQSNMLIKGQTQVGLLIFLGSTMGMAFVEGLFEHRVKTLSYGDGS
ncbi:hypothetical protein Ahy_A09g045955 [Arachis hypogaea]|uniref:Uncharacterized protein n=1 Tax=Arachis hypogaea TaxID=3818 RepID=A0A445BNI4_ARAHY|nr:hypothetical protein Ahy_A09g045955 [Arachis hypogaea]